jgi:hypothetical protein
MLIIRGIQIDRNLQQPENENRSMIFNVGCASKTINKISSSAKQLAVSFVTEFETMTDSIEGLSLCADRDSIIEIENLRPLAQIEFRGKNKAIDSETLQRSAVYE